MDHYKYIDGAPTVLLTEAEVVAHEADASVVKHVDLWNHNVEFIEEDDVWARPAVFIEFAPIAWKPMKGHTEYTEYTARSQVLLHVVTDWAGSASAGSQFQEDSLEVFDLLNDIHKLLQDFSGEGFDHLDLVESRTNHNHEEIVENIEVYEYRGTKWV